jgi:hypothetical protein
MLNTKFKKLLLTSSLLVATGAANAGYSFDLTENDKITFGGYIKADLRTISGEVNSPATNDDYWIGLSSVVEDRTTTDFNVNETRFNAKYVHGDVSGYIEMDFNGGGGNEIISNSSNPRLRHAFIKYKNVLVGQTWTTFMSTSAIPESVDFAGPANSIAFLRQGQIRYTNGGLQLALENPYSDLGDATEDSIPDVVAKYNFKGDWGDVSVAGVVRQLNTVGGDTESAVGYGVAGRIKTTGKDDIRFQLHGGNTGRYVGVLSSRDLVGEEAEESTSYMVAYRHFWSDDLRSTVYYGSSDADKADTKRNHVAVNLFKSLTKQLTIGVEVGNFEMDEVNKSSDYLQFTAKYVL